MYESDSYHPVLSFDGDAHDTLDRIIRSLAGFGVTLTLEDDSEVEAVLSKPVYDEATERLYVEFYRVVDGDYPDIESVPADRLERRFARRIQIA